MYIHLSFKIWNIYLSLYLSIYYVGGEPYGVVKIEGMSLRIRLDCRSKSPTTMCANSCVIQI